VGVKQGGERPEKKGEQKNETTEVQNFKKEKKGTNITKKKVRRDISCASCGGNVKGSGRILDTMRKEVKRRKNGMVRRKMGEYNSVGMERVMTGPGMSGGMYSQKGRRGEARLQTEVR